jgi:hypothetical protein
MSKDGIQQNKRLLTLAKTLLMILVIILAFSYTVGILTGHSIIPHF